MQFSTNKYVPKCLRAALYWINLVITFEQDLLSRATIISKYWSYFELRCRWNQGDHVEIKKHPLSTMQYYMHKVKWCETWHFLRFYLGLLNVPVVFTCFRSFVLGERSTHGLVQYYIIVLGRLKDDLLVNMVCFLRSSTLGTTCRRSWGIL